MTEFEKEFDFRFRPDLRTFLCDHNAGKPKSGIFPTSVKERQIRKLYNFADKSSKNEAWEVNKRMRECLGPKRIAIGVDTTGNIICVERHYSHQEIKVYNHASREFEDCLLDIPGLLRCIN